MPSNSILPFNFMMCMTMLTLTTPFRYGVSILHQITLVSYRASASKWADRVREPSQQALWESTSSSVMVLKELLDKDLIHFLPVSAYVFSLPSSQHTLCGLTTNPLRLKSPKLTFVFLVSYACFYHLSSIT
jgi:hypothetical protein